MVNLDEPPYAGVDGRRRGGSAEDSLRVLLRLSEPLPNVGGHPLSARVRPASSRFRPFIHVSGRRALIDRRASRLN